MPRRLAAAFVVLSSALVPVPAFAATPPPVTAPPLPDGAVFDPRVIPSVADAQASLDAARGAVDDANDRLDAAVAEQGDVRSQIARLTGTDRDLTRTIQSTRGRLRSLAVAAYIGGGPVGTIQVLADAPDAAELTWRRYLVRSSVEATVEAARAYDASKQGVGDDLVALATRADQLDTEITTAHDDVVRSEVAVADAELALGAAQHEADHRAGRIVVRSGDDGGPVPEVSKNAAGPAWAALRNCESGGNYAIADSTGMFRGAYQFAISTWYGLGGVGDPADAPPSEQDYRAQILYDALGAKPWPVCGRFLLEDPPARADAIPGLVDGLPSTDLTGPGVTDPTSTTTSSSTSTSISTTSTSTTTTLEPTP
jgi:hypothetical protein